MDETPREPEGVEHEVRARALATEEREEPTSIPPATPPLRRRDDGRIVAGVAGGLADRLRIPAWIVRIPFGFAAFVDATLAWQALDGGGSPTGVFGVGSRIAAFGILGGGAYVLLWWVVPREDLGVSPMRRGVRRFAISPVRSFAGRYPGMRSWPGLALLAFGGALLANQLGIWDPIVAIAIGFIALGLVLYRRDAVPAGNATQRQTVTGTRPEPAIATERSEPRPPREHSPLGWITFGLALLVGCVIVMWANASASVDANGRTVGLSRIAAAPAVSLLVLGAGLIIGSVFGRARWLIVPAVFIVPFMLITSVIDLPLEGHLGGISYHPRTAASVPNVAVHNLGGNVWLQFQDLRHADDDEFTIDASNLAGDIYVIVPYDAWVHVRASAAIGSLYLGPQTTSGMRAADSATLPPSVGDGPAIELDLRTGIGDVYVSRISPTKAQRRAEERLARRQENGRG
jgi:phage shock protein PspC (stress-responsive transcriptional regulator)